MKMRGKIGIALLFAGVLLAAGLANANPVREAIKGPDLTIASLDSSNHSPSVGDTVAITVVTKNNGAKAAGTTTTRVGKDSGYANFAIPALARNAQVTNTTSYTCTTAGIHFINATADYYSAVNETNESNNFRRISINCTEPARPDLVVEQIAHWVQFSNASIKIVNFNMSVKNQGNAAAAGFWDALEYGDGQPGDMFFVGSLNAGARAWHYSTHYYYNSSNFTVSGYADYLSNVTESDEYNNWLSIVV
ncbi:MAG: CARDB domain-containing protein [Candidatus Micrarchaeota archaeon]